MNPYATAAEYESFTGATAPTDIDRQLARASELIDSVVAVAYEIDENGIPTDADVAATLRDATCAQVEFWGKSGEAVDVSGVVADSFSLGDLSVSGMRGAGPGRDGLAPRARRILANAGLLVGVTAV